VRAVCVSARARVCVRACGVCVSECVCVFLWVCARARTCGVSDNVCVLMVCVCARVWCVRVCALCDVCYSVRV
jgi:hypothetical protein